MDRIKQHFQSEAEAFDRIILKLIPFYPEMVEALVSAIPFRSNERIRVIDLGCGTGTITKKIKERFPESRVTCLDLAGRMIEAARIKLRSYKHIEYRVGDFTDIKFDKRYDAAISSLAIHHLKTDQQKKIFLKKIYQALDKGGVFYNADIILGSSPHLLHTYMKKWMDFMHRSISLTEIRRKWIKKYRNEDHPAVFMSQVKWLEDTGFEDIDILWKYYNFAVYGGRK